MRHTTALGYEAGDFLPISRRGDEPVLKAVLINIRVGVSERKVLRFLPAQSLQFCPEISWKFLLLPRRANLREQSQGVLQEGTPDPPAGMEPQCFPTGKTVGIFLLHSASYSMLFGKSSSHKDFSTCLSLQISSETAVIHRAAGLWQQGRYAQG